jgi:hypothetical protein
MQEVIFLKQRTWKGVLSSVRGGGRDCGSSGGSSVGNVSRLGGQGPKSDQEEDCGVTSGSERRGSKWKGKGAGGKAAGTNGGAARAGGGNEVET